MSTSGSFRFGTAAFAVLALPVFGPVGGRCAAQETGPCLLHKVTDARQFADRRASLRVVVAAVRAVPLLLCDPDAAFALLKEGLHAVREDPDLSEGCRERLASHLECALAGVAEGGLLVKRLQNECLGLKAEVRVRLDLLISQLGR